VDGAQVAEYLPLWQASCPLDVARKRLKVRAATIRSWRKKGLLESVIVFGFERVTLASVTKMEQRKKSRIFLVKPGYVRKSHLLDFLGVAPTRLNALLASGDIPSIEVNGVVLIPEETAADIEARWSATCKPAGVKNALGLSDYGYQHFLDQGTLEEVTIFGVRRVTLESVKRTKEANRARIAARKAQKESWAAARWTAKTRKEKARREREKQRAERKAAKTRARAVAKKGASRTQPQRQVKPVKAPLSRAAQISKLISARTAATPLAPVTVPGYESRRLTSCEEVARAARKPVDYVRSKYVAGTLRGVETEIERTIYIYLSSAEAFLQKLSQKS
jgi:hypothetical protein